LKTVIFGGAGFVGLNLAEALKERGDEVVLFDRSPPPIEGFDFVSRDVRDKAAVEDVVVEGVDCVIWGAAITANAERDAAEPELIVDTNLAALAPVLRRARDSGVRRVINLSSVAAYGEAAFSRDALDENLPSDPHGLYSLTKFSSERLCSRLSELWSLDAVSVRLSAVFGPWERATGTRDTPSPFLRLMALAERGAAALLPRPGVRDWLYAPDAARAVLALVDAPRLVHRLYNIGPGRSFSVLDWGKQLAARRPGFSCTVGKPANVDLGGDRDRAPLSVQRLAEETGFRARFGLKESVKHLDEWARAHPGWFKESA
jgi:UDP-glucose 4-epimerase